MVIGRENMDDRDQLPSVLGRPAPRRGRLSGRCHVRPAGVPVVRAGLAAVGERSVGVARQQALARACSRRAAAGPAWDGGRVPLGRAPVDPARIRPLQRHTGTRRPALAAADERARTAARAVEVPALAGRGARSGLGRARRGCRRPHPAGVRRRAVAGRRRTARAASPRRRPGPRATAVGAGDSDDQARRTRRGGRHVAGAPGPAVPAGVRSWPGDARWSWYGWPAPSRCWYAATSPSPGSPTTAGSPTLCTSRAGSGPRTAWHPGPTAAPEALGRRSPRPGCSRWSAGSAPMIDADPSPVRKHLTQLQRSRRRAGTLRTIPTAGCRPWT